MPRAILALLLLCGPACAAGTVGGPARVIDGDTIEVQGTRLHLYGIDAPEPGQLCGRAGGTEYRCDREAARALRARIGSAAVTCERREGERRGLASATCHADGEDLAAYMVAQGHALASRRLPASHPHRDPARADAPRQDYVRLEGQAWATRRGLWAGTFEKPADWRQGRRRFEATATGAVE